MQHALKRRYAYRQENRAIGRISDCYSENSAKEFVTHFLTPPVSSASEFAHMTMFMSQTAAVSTVFEHQMTSSDCETVVCLIGAYLTQRTRPTNSNGLMNMSQSHAPTDVSAGPSPRFVWSPVGSRIEGGTSVNGSTDCTVPVEPSEIPGWENWDHLAEMWVLNVHEGPDAACREFMVTRPLMELVGNIESLRVLDAGCGEGFYSRMMAEKGAQVTGVDSSGKLIEAARNLDKQDSRTQYKVCSLLDLQSLGQFDVVVTNQVINLVPDLPGIFRQFAAVLAESGRLVVSIAHPCFDGVGPGWTTRPNGERFWTNSRYGQRVYGRASHGAPAIHRPISHYISTARSAGFALLDMKEPVVPDEAMPLLNGNDFQFVDRPANLFLHFVRRADSDC